MTSAYEQEQKDLQSRVVALRETLSKAKAQRLNIDFFLAQARKYTEVRTKKQTILIHWNFIGAVELPQDLKKSA